MLNLLTNAEYDWTNPRDKVLRVIIPLDVRAFEAAMPKGVAQRMDIFEAGTTGVIDACVNLWPWIGFKDFETARSVMEEAIAQNYGIDVDENLRCNDACFQIAVGFSNLISEQVPPHATGPMIPSTDYPPNWVCTGGACTAVDKEHVIVDLYYAEM